jgi:hypothetical protein
LVQKIENYIQNQNINTFKDVIIPIALSLISAVIFWLIFNLLPAKYRYLKIRPKIEYSIKTICSNLFSYFDLIFRHNIYSPSFFQKEIINGTISKDDIFTGLQNKCLNTSYQYDKNACILIPIGDKLLSNANKISYDIDRLLVFNNYLSASEIILLEKIRTLLFTYDLKSNSSIPIGGLIFRPANPNISYMANNLFSLYQLFFKLQQITFSNKYMDRDILLHAVQYYFYSNHYFKCKCKIITNRYRKEYRDCFQILQFYNILCDYKKGLKKIAIKKLGILLNEKISLIGSRTLFESLLENDTGDSIKKLLCKYYKDDEVNNLLNTLNEEKKQRDAFLNQAKKIQEDYKT